MELSKELRIGNLLHSPATIRNVAVNPDLLRIIAIEEQNNAGKTQYFPVKITEEILLKGGFEKVDYLHEDRSVSKGFYRFGKFILNDFNVINTNNQSYTVLLENIVLKRKLNYITSVKYVHELQNLVYSITKKELNIKL